MQAFWGALLHYSLLASELVNNLEGFLEAYQVNRAENVDFFFNGGWDGITDFLPAWK